jgi:hypothetical protein
MKTPPGVDLDAFVPKLLDGKHGGRRVLLGQPRLPKQRDLFSILDKSADGRTDLGEVTEFVISPDLKLTVDARKISPTAMQSLIGALWSAFPPKKKKSGKPIAVKEIDENSKLTVWSSDPSARKIALDVWKAVQAGGATSDLEAWTTPKLYGVKLKLTEMLVGSACSTLPAGSPVLDVMAGTGIVSRMLSARYDVSANDANPYAALLVRSQGARLSEDPDGILRRIKKASERNFRELVELAPERFAKETDFLHGELNAKRFEAYERFCQEPVLAPEGPPSKGRPYQLCISRYANVYFGLTQAAQLDSIRAAIDRVSPEQGDVRDLLLAALLIAATVCSTGPHFAQPRKLTAASFRDTIERRARSVVWEFELALRRLTARPPLRRPIRAVTQLDWRDAIPRFAAGLGGRPAAVYFDPPYSKLQYSRYYHVLNVLISYDYPTIQGVGRYPPMADRFSSRFENRPLTAQNEFEQAFDMCRDLGLNTLVSYSGTGFVPIEILSAAMRARFREVLEFSERIRHHSQGTRLGEHLGHVTEYVFVGRV